MNLSRAAKKFRGLEPKEKPRPAAEKKGKPPAAEPPKPVEKVEPVAAAPAVVEPPKPAAVEPAVVAPKPPEQPKVKRPRFVRPKAEKRERVVLPPLVSSSKPLARVMTKNVVLVPKDEGKVL
jgi:hypothetical protein